MSTAIYQPKVKGQQTKKKRKTVGGRPYNNAFATGQRKIAATGNSRKTRYIKRGTIAPHMGGQNDVFGKK